MLFVENGFHPSSRFVDVARILDARRASAYRRKTV